MRNLYAVLLSIGMNGCALQVKPIDICHDPITNKPHGVQYVNCLLPTTSVDFNLGGHNAEKTD